MKQTLAQRLRTLREEKGFTQEKLAKELGIARMTIVCYESGKNSPDGNMLSKMCKIFDCTPDYLFGFSDLKNPQSRQMWIASVKTLGAAIGTLPQERQKTLVTVLNSLLQDNYMLNETIKIEDFVVKNVTELLSAYAEIIRCLTTALVSGKTDIAAVYETIEKARSNAHGSMDRTCLDLMGALLRKASINLSCF